MRISLGQWGINSDIIYLRDSNAISINQCNILYGPFAIEKKETAKKFFFELIVILDIFQPKNHIWHININFIFLAVSPLSIAKDPYIQFQNLVNGT